MKSNKVRMNISREMHEWFKSIDGKTNDEKMEKLKLYEMKGDTLSKLYIQRGQSLLNTMKTSQRYQELYYKLKRENSALKKMLTLSVVISWSAAICLAYVQGWFV